MPIQNHRVKSTYKIYTYCFNTNPDWKKKAILYFYPENFHSEYTAHGKHFERTAIEAYEKYSGLKVTTCGTVISLNSWLSYSPNDIIMKNGKPYKLLEVKCPFAGKTKSITDILDKLKFLKIENDLITFKTNHEYNCQVQMGMAMLNVDSTDFVFYASCDISFIVINICFDEEYIINVLIKVKKKIL